MDALNRLWARVVALGRGPGVLAAAALVALAIGGAVWMVTAGGAGSTPAGSTPNVDQPSAPQIHTAPDGQPAAPAAADNIWLSEAERARQRQAERLTTLGRLVSDFPGVHSAVVLSDPGRPGTIGRPSVKATAAVHIRMADSQAMTGSLAGAIGDLVAGSLAGLDRRDVHIVDQRGHSYRVDDPRLAVEAHLAWEARLAADWEQRIRKVLAHIPGLTVAAGIRSDGPRCWTAALAVPRSHFERIAASRAVNVEHVIDAECEQIRILVAKILGDDSAADVTVTCYYDMAAAAPPPAEHSLAPAGLYDSRPVTWAAAGLLLVSGGLCGWAAVIRRRRGPVAPTHIAAAAPDAAEDAPVTPSALARLKDLSDEDLHWLLEKEPPREIAVVLTGMEPRRSAAVVAGLDRGVQQDVVAHFGSLGPVDDATVDEVARSLMDRLDALHGPTREGPIPAAPQTPVPRTPVFEDIVFVPDEQARAGLAGVDPSTLAVALRTSGQAVREKIFGCLPRRATRRVRRQMERMAPVRLSEVEAAQEDVAAAVQYESDAAPVAIRGVVKA